MELAEQSPTSSAADVNKLNCAIHPIPKSLQEQLPCSPHDAYDLRRDAAHRYSPAEVVAVAREAVQGVPAEISTSYVERSNLTIRMESRRFTRLTNGFSKKLECHAAAVSL